MILSELLAQAFEAEIVRSGMSVRKFEAEHGLKQYSLRGLTDPKNRRVPTVDRANELCRVINYELRLVRLRPRRRGRQRKGTEVAAADAELAAILALIAQEYDGLNGRGRKSMAVRFWSAFPELEVERTRLENVVSHLIIKQAGTA
ncbi:MAG: hypothetical protein OXH64_10815 [Rhodospirillaceae bacterium]|nr:hypothetical protein [Rhodospirillaceae bacterium]